MIFFFFSLTLIDLIRKIVSLEFTSLHWTLGKQRTFVGFVNGRGKIAKLTTFVVYHERRKNENSKKTSAEKKPLFTTSKNGLETLESGSRTRRSKIDH